MEDKQNIAIITDFDPTQFRKSCKIPIDVDFDALFCLYLLNDLNDVFIAQYVFFAASLWLVLR
jgi:hypothetical protein